MDSEDGKIFVKNLAYFVHTHERALANALQLQRQKIKNGNGHAAAASSTTSSSNSSTSISLTELLSRPYLSMSSATLKPAKLTFTPHHLFYLLTKFEDELGVDVGAMKVRLENLHSDTLPSNYISFLGNAPKSRGKQSDAESLRSVSSVRSVLSNVSSVWSAMTLSNSLAKAEKQEAQYRDDLKYLYSCFTKIPALRLSPDHRARLVEGFEEFPFDTAVPLFAFKNVSSLEICDLDFRQFHGWDRLSEQLRSLTVKRAGVDDPIDLLQNIVLDDLEKRRKRSSKTQMPQTPSTPGSFWPYVSTPPKSSHRELSRSISSPTTPIVKPTRRASLGAGFALARGGSADGTNPSVEPAPGTNSPPRPTTGIRPSTLNKPSGRAGTPNFRRSSGSSGSSLYETSPRHSASDLLSIVALPSSKWRFLRHLSLAENGLTELHASSLAPVAGTLQSLDLSGNLFAEIPSEALASLTHLRALNLSNCMISSLSSLSKSPLPAITTLNLRSNRLLSLAGIERLLSLERLDVRENRLHDPTELARLTGMPNFSDLYVIRNPFTRTHSDYRITVFNLFRLAPGHVEDVVVDTMGPLYHEKRHLVDRAAELANKPVIKPTEVEDLPTVKSHPPADTGSESIPTDRSPRNHNRSISDTSPVLTARRRKPPRRRVVELGQAEPRSSVQESQPAETTVPELMDLPAMPHTPNTESDQSTTPESTPYRTAPTTQLSIKHSFVVRPTLDTSYSSPVPPQPKIRDASDDDNSPTRSPEGFGSSPVAYRHKVQAPRAELGPNWLSALNEERFVSAEASACSFSPASQTSTLQPDKPSQSRSVGMGGRTLG